MGTMSVTKTLVLASALVYATLAVIYRYGVQLGVPQ